ncbi:MAG: L-fucose/L-arabinose isomerase family protein [Candidatus Marinimicrobia bacterium]|nr:L-fucose/L-arabinose isomerase family protein [Candidatus Neomarinimicrobiota bacterium]
MSQKKTTLGLIVGNRGFFPDHLCQEGRETMLKVLEAEGFGVVTLTPEDTKFGSIESWDDAKRCAALFQRHAEDLDGILVTLPNFGDERAVADTLKMAALGIPVFIHAFPDNIERMTIKDRRDSFCGKMSVCNNLRQYNVPFTLTSLHTMDPESPAFRAELRQFGACCRVVRGLSGARIGAIGARPAAFNTVRYSEKLLEDSGISVETIDLFEVFGRVNRLADSDEQVKAKLAAIEGYAPCQGQPPEGAMLKMAKFGVVVDQWTRALELDATAVQCWTAMEEFFGVVPCTIMSMLSESLQPSACEVDICGAVAMLGLRLAAGQPSALLDWNNNFGADPDLCMLFHCSNLPRSFFEETRLDYQDIIGGSVGRENAFGTCVGRIRPGPFTYARVSTDDVNGQIRAYLGEGEFLTTEAPSFGGYGVARIPELQSLLQHICQNGFEHHVAVNRTEVAAGLHEALANYYDWDVYWHG